MSDIEMVRPLVDEVLGRASEPRQREGACLFADLNALRPVPRAPVATVHELIPQPHWTKMLGEELLQCEGPEARAIEWRLRRDLWADEHIGDDRPLFAQVCVYAAYHSPNGWGVPLEQKRVGDSRKAYKPIPPMADGIDVSRLQVPEFVHDEAETRRRVERARELVEGRLDVSVQTPHLGLHIFDLAVAMRGMGNLLMDCALAPEKVCALMEFVTEAYVEHHAARAAAGLVNCATSPCGDFQVLDWAFYHCAWQNRQNRQNQGQTVVSSDGEAQSGPAPIRGKPPSVPGCDGAPTLADEWAYTSAQTSAGLGPKQFERFVFPYNARVAELFTNGTVYFHGCECLDGKYPVLQGLPNLRRIHVSPWSSVRRAHEVFGRSVVLEVHAHPTEVFFTHTPMQMADELRRLLDDAGDARLDLNLNDIHSINDDPDRLRLWTDLAREVSAESGPR